jgi:hypothetical protein
VEELSVYCGLSLPRRIAEGGEAHEHHRPGRRLGNGGWAGDNVDRQTVRVRARAPVVDICLGRQTQRTEGGVEIGRGFREMRA